MENETEIVRAIRQIAKGFERLADAIEGDGAAAEGERELALLREWGERGLTRA
jgi:hypothetical protein